MHQSGPSKNANRRDFLLAAASATMVPAISGKAAIRSISANDKINLGREVLAAASTFTETGQ